MFCFRSSKLRGWEMRRGCLRPDLAMTTASPMAFQQEHESGIVESESTNQLPTAHVEDFLRYTLVSKEEISATCAIFTLRPADGAAISFGRLVHCQVILSVQIIHPESQILRSYTPLSPLPGQHFLDLRFLIRKAFKGEVSGYLHKSALGSKVELRGPVFHCILPKRIHTLLLLAGGVGIAPAMQIAEHVEMNATLHILWGSRWTEECAGGISDTLPSAEKSGSKTSKISQSFSRGPVNTTSPDVQLQTIVGQLESYKESRPGRMQIEYFVDEENTFIRPGDIIRILDANRGYANNVLLVSGPDGFVEYWAGAKQVMNGKQLQGHLAGVLATLDLQGWQVIKL